MLKNNINNILTYIFSLVICVCLILISKDIINYRKAASEYKKLEEYMTDGTTPKGDDAITELSPVRLEKDEVSDYDRLHEINQDLVGILSIPELDLKYPVVQAEDNSEYLDMTFEGNKNPAGCLFMDYENSNDFTDPNTYVYGHNMKDGSMFGSLKKLIRDEKGNSQMKAYVSTSNEKLTYILDDAKVVNIDDYAPPSDADGLLTLYTCWGNDKGKRLLVTFVRTA